MPFVPAPNIVMAEVRCLQAAQKIENRIMVNCLTDPTPAIIQSIVDNTLGWAQGIYMPLVTSSVSLVEVVGTDMSDINGVQIAEAPSVPTVGGLGNNPMPNETSFCVSLRTGSRGRSARGRWYAMGIDKGVVTSNTVTEAYRANITNAVEALVDDINGLGYQVSIVSYISNKVPRPGGPVYFPVTSVISVDDVVDSMRRRKPGVGT